MATLDLHDVQGIVIRGYGRLKGARFVLLHVADGRAAKRWLLDLGGRVTSALRRPAASAVNVAFTHAGLVALGVPDDTPGFAPEFVEGMAGDHRGRMLGDVGANAPALWAWGGPTATPVHAILLLYATDAPAVTALLDAHRRSLASAGVDEIGVLDTHLLPVPGGVKEHFGFRDGIAQPAITNTNGLPAWDAAGVLRPDRPENTVAPGEFLFGYRNEYAEYPDSPAVWSDPTGLLPPLDDGASRRFDLGRNGTYLVVRQLQQHVSAFWRFVASAAGGTEGAIRLASKMIGRWPSGAPLVVSPDYDRAGLETYDDFGYAATDPNGFACPFGSHMRRANPRDDLLDDPEDSIREAKRHRIIRRGRAYGPPLHGSLDPAAMIAAEDDGRERGLHFLAVNADIERQFEFLQHTWINNPKIAGLYADPDPLFGDPRGPVAAFHEQADPVRRRWTGLPPFIRMRGGAYFFLPGLQALRYLAHLP